MKERFLKSHLFLCCSSLENSPNSLGEAMLLGVPCISTEVGGIPSLFDGGRDGLWCRGHQLSKVAENDKYASDASESKIAREIIKRQNRRIGKYCKFHGKFYYRNVEFSGEMLEYSKMQENMQEKPMIKSRISQNCRKSMQT